MEIGWKLHFQTLFLKQLFVWSLDIYLVKQCISVPFRLFFKSLFGLKKVLKS